MIDLTDCPECGAPAEVRWRAEFSGTEGRAGILCAVNHWNVVPATSLPVVAASPIPTQRADSPEGPAVTWQPSRRKSQN